jgi:hypothetical protein
VHILQDASIIVKTERNMWQEMVRAGTRCPHNEIHIEELPRYIDYSRQRQYNMSPAKTIRIQGNDDLQNCEI